MGLFRKNKKKARDRFVEKALAGEYTYDDSVLHTRRYTDVPIEDFEGQFRHIYLSYWDYENEKPLKEMILEFVDYRYPSGNQHCFYSRKVKANEVETYFSGVALEKIYAQIERCKKQMKEMISRVEWRQKNTIHGTVSNVQFVFEPSTKDTKGVIYRQILLEDRDVILLRSHLQIRIGKTYRFYRWPETLVFDKVKKVG